MTNRAIRAAERALFHPDHHLWRNGRIWWVAFTFHFSGRKFRVRRSLGTAQVDAARQRRDELLERYARQPGWTLALRFPREPSAEPALAISA